MPAGYTQAPRICQDDAPKRRSTEERIARVAHQELVSEDSEGPSSGGDLGKRIPAELHDSAPKRIKLSSGNVGLLPGASHASTSSR